MAGKRKKKSTFAGGRTAAAALSLCLLVIMAIAGMYTVGRTEQQEQELEEQIAQAEETARKQQTREEQTESEKEQETEEKQEADPSDSEQQSSREAASQAVARQQEEALLEPELESEFETEMADAEDVSLIAESVPAASSGVSASMSAQTPALSFSPDTDSLLWPVAGNIILDYSMDKSVYFATLDQYKYNPAVIIQGSVNDAVLCGAQGRVTSVETLEETGTTVTLDIGNGYELVYGQLKELTVKEGDYREAGETIGYVSEPTRYYTKEGCNVYFEVRKDGESIDPMGLLS